MSVYDDDDEDEDDDDEDEDDEDEDDDDEDDDDDLSELHTGVCLQHRCFYCRCVFIVNCILFL